MSFSLLMADQDLVKVDLSAIFSTLNSDWFVLCPWAISFFPRLCPAPFPPVTPLTTVSQQLLSKWVRVLSLTSPVLRTKPMKTVGTGQAFMKGIPQHVLPVAFSSYPSAPPSIYAFVCKVLGRSSAFYFQKDALFASPIWVNNVASAIFWWENQKMACPWEGNIV